MNQPRGVRDPRASPKGARIHLTCRSKPLDPVWVVSVLWLVIQGVELLVNQDFPGRLWLALLQIEVGRK
jgi:hypothetical protein